MSNETVKLSEVVDNKIEFDNKGSKYSIRFDKANHLALRIGFDATKTNYHKFVNDERVLASLPVIHGFKHYRKNGSKFWTHKPGIDILVVVPAEYVEVVKFAGYSYVKILINGAELTLSVSGGTDIQGNGWTDHVGKVAATGVGLSQKTIKRILEVAYYPPEDSEFEYNLQHNSSFDQDLWQDMVARHSVKVQPGMNLVLKDGYSAFGDNRNFIATSKYGNSGKIWMTAYNNNPAVKVKVELSKVNFLETAKLNGIDVVNPDSFRKIVTAS